MRTIGAVEFHNLTEVLPIEAISWYDQHKIEQEALSEYQKTGADKFFEKALVRMESEKGGI